LNLTEAQIGALVAFLIDALTDERIPMLLATLCMAMPRQQRLGRDDRGDLLQNFATNFLAFAARRHLWSSVKRSRRPICARRTRFSSTRYRSLAAASGSTNRQQKRRETKTDLGMFASAEPITHLNAVRLVKKARIEFWTLRGLFDDYRVRRPQATPAR
jgi:hypothetical protein